MADEVVFSILKLMGVDTLTVITVFIGSLLAINIISLIIDYLNKKSKQEMPCIFQINAGTVVLFTFLLVFIAALIIRRLWTK